MGIGGLLVGALSLSISYCSSFSGPDIRLSASPPAWRWAPFELNTVGQAAPSPAAQSSALWMTATCAFTNLGARGGVVDNVSVRFESEDDTTRWLFAPYAVIEGVASKHFKDSFYPLTVPGKQSVSLTYLFFPENGLNDFQYPQLNPHRFKVSFLTWADGDSHWRTQQQFTIDLDSDVVAQLASGTLFVTPFSESQQRFRALK